ncbi:MAG: isochorismatase family protein [Planctomycetia bacterium]
MTQGKSSALLSAESCCLAVIDVQEKLIPVISGADSVIRSCRFLMEAAQLMQVPTFLTEQYPPGLGHTVPELTEGLTELSCRQKLRFSAADVIERQVAEDSPNGRGEPSSIVLVGIEAHICLLQTALDLTHRGYQVVVAADATGSRDTCDHDFALKRLAAGGVTVTTAESIVFEWCESAEHPNFRTLSQLVRSRRR